MSTTDTGKDVGTETGTQGAGAAGESEAAKEREAAAQLSTAPSEEKLNVPSLGPLGWARWFWRQLTSMRVALILLFLLSLGAIPGSVIPQTPVDALKVEKFRADHTTLAPLYDKLQLFDVYTSVWFSAIYILLFVSLIGCIVPRTWQFVGQLRSRPPRAPRRLDRMPVYTTWRTEAAPDQVLGAARTLLRRRRFRTHQEQDDGGPSRGAVASEKGYLREAGNLAFHIALIVLLLAFASGQLFKSEGRKLIVQGDSFSNVLTQYDDFQSGSLFTSDMLDPFSFRLKDFHATYETSGPNKGTARDYRAEITHTEGGTSEGTESTIKVNHPLQVGSSKVYLIANGYAPVVSVKDGKGNLAYRGPVPFLQQDNNQTSSGVVKVPDYVDAKGRKDQVGFQGFFVPDFQPDSGTMFSQSPLLKNPAMFLTAYHGNLGVDGGPAQNVYQLDTDNMEKFKEKDGSPFAKKLTPGDTMTLPNGAGSLEFEGVKEWANFQVSHQVGNGWALGGALAAIAGLAGSLFIQRRRVWVRAYAGDDGRTVVEMAALGRSESARLPDELASLATDMQDAAPVASETSADAADEAATDEADASKTPADPAQAPEGAGK
ncbi:cytochrome c biogenesis protein ResB [Streptomyces diacarni]|uniref:Cytochrome c biogenesis protein ResB n=1 Tax=Streptomyces diacarni TaxID=2800381 RepID=A0A367ES51_9ACTN|nr:cytochrome c biogenesis protein ResB [Streptomyces diacarni]RCG20871.1 cytochrome c biogenesis protein ResB [Streptomyces diacarni]